VNLAYQFSITRSPKGNSTLWRIFHGSNDVSHFALRWGLCQVRVREGAGMVQGHEGNWWDRFRKTPHGSEEGRPTVV